MTSCGNDARYSIPEQRFVVDEALASRYREAEAETLARLANREGRPAAMESFSRLLGEGWRLEELKADPRPKIGYLCNFVPDEVVLGAGGIPLRLDVGSPPLAESGAQIVPRGVCPEVRSILGAQLTRLPYYELADLLVVPTACDGKRKLVQTLGERRAVFPLETPQRKDYGDHRWRDTWYRQTRSLADAIKRAGGKRLGRRRLADALKAVARRSALTRELYTARRDAPGVLSGSDTLLVMQASFVADIDWWNEKVEVLLEELRASPKADPKSERPRVLLTGAPIYFPSFSLLDVVESAGAEIVGDELCSGTQRLYHPPVIDERSKGGMLRAAADRVLMPNTCPCFTSGDDRLDQLLERVEQTGAQGVIHHSLRLCQLFEMELPRVSATLKARGIPVLTLHTEESEQDTAILENRVHAFLEMIGSYL